MGKSFDTGYWQNLGQPQQQQPQGPQPVQMGQDWAPVPTAPQTRTINPWQSAAMESEQQASHQASQAAIGQSEQNVRQGVLDAEAEALGASREGSYFNGYTSDDELFRAAGRGDFGDFSQSNKNWYTALANDRQRKGQTGSQLISNLGERGFVGQKGGLSPGNENRLATLLDAAQAGNKSYMAHEAEQAGAGIEQQGGIMYGPGMPTGGAIAPQQTFTPHTDFTEKNKVRTGIGGGEAEQMRTPNRDELIAARPDLHQAAPIAQAQVAAPQGPVNSIQNQMAQAKALRAGGQNG